MVTCNLLGIYGRFEGKFSLNLRVVLYPKDEDICFSRNAGKIALHYAVIFVSHCYDGLKSPNIIWFGGDARCIGPPHLLAHRFNFIK